MKIEPSPFDWTSNEAGQACQVNLSVSPRKLFSDCLGIMSQGLFFWSLGPKSVKLFITNFYTPTAVARLKDFHYNILGFFLKTLKFLLFMHHEVTENNAPIT